MAASHRTPQQEHIWTHLEPCTQHPWLALHPVAKQEGAGSRAKAPGCC